MDQQQYVELYEKFLAGRITPEEQHLLLTYGRDFLSNDSWPPELGEKEEIKNSLFLNINKAIDQKKVVIIGRTIWWVAASIALFLIATAVWLASNSPKQYNHTSFTTKNNLKQDVLPGSNNAVLTLANGQKVTLNNAKYGVLTTQGNTQVVKLNNGQLAYNHTDINNTETYYNTMTTPRGGNYSLLLADGTRVVLNAESSITYPTAFNGKNREVTITGEAYFEVAKNPAHPFIVNANGTQTQVLGTHFNIMAYNNEPDIKTTLLEGSVKFIKNNQTTLLKPGQQAIAKNGDSHITVQEVDQEDAVAWKNGYFVFQDEDIHSIMRKVARWYNVDIVYEGDNLDGLSFGGSVSRYKNISSLLNMLQSTGTIHFKLGERRVTVMK